MTESPVNGKHKKVLTIAPSVSMDSDGSVSLNSVFAVFADFKVAQEHHLATIDESSVWTEIEYRKVLNSIPEWARKRLMFGEFIPEDDLDKFDSKPD